MCKIQRDDGRSIPRMSRKIFMGKYAHQRSPSNGEWELRVNEDGRQGSIRVNIFRMRRQRDRPGEITSSIAYRGGIRRLHVRSQWKREMIAFRWTQPKTICRLPVDYLRDGPSMKQGWSSPTAKKVYQPMTPPIGDVFFHPKNFEGF